MPRGTGKTTLCIVAVIWAILTGRHAFVFLLAPSGDYAEEAIGNLKTLLVTNDLLLADYPEAVWPIRCIEGEARRCGGQRYYGRLTDIEWGTDRIALATIPGARCSNAIIRVSGLTGGIRGAMHVRPDGTSIRPSLVVVDDPQTDGSARSPTQCRERLSIINGAVLGLAGPGKTVAALMPCTVIRAGDVADHVLDRELNPQWRGERTKMVNEWPTNEALWAEYTRLRKESQRAGGHGESATEFYRKNQEAMDVGAVVAWPARKQPEELSPIQHAMNIRCDRGDAAFFAEYQNDPIPDEQPAEDLLTAEQIASKTCGIGRGIVPEGTEYLTMFIDIQQTALFWLVAAWEGDFTGYVVDYGAEPDQKDAYFTLRTIRRKLQMVTPSAGLEGAIYAGLERLTARTLGREWQRDDGSVARIDRCLIDANWGQSTDVIYQFCRQSEYSALLTPSHGRYVGASSCPFSDYPKRPGERRGLNWIMRRGVARNRTVRHITFDTNYWKSFIQSRFAVPIGDPGSLVLFGRKPEQHRLIADHLTSEYRVRTEGRGRTVDEWKLGADGRDNHWLDCIVGAAVAASMLGANLFGAEAQPVARPRIKLSDIQRSRPMR